MEIVGYFGAVLIGLFLGLIGGGGSILTVPILVYFFAIDPVLATAYSLFVVGITSLIGIVGKIRAREVEYKTAFVFAIPSFVAVFLSRYFIVPHIPDELLPGTAVSLSKETAIMVLFATIMLFSAVSMIRSSKRKAEAMVFQQKKLNYPLVAIEGLLVGGVTGLVGAGGGFLIVPALVLLVGLPMKKAVGTSLFIIAIKSLIGFTGDLAASQAIDWAFLLLFSFIAVGGIFIGLYTASYVSGAKLKRMFGYFVFLMAVVILLTELVQ
jgi:uncharacterized membrane protein YfcA